MRFDFLHVYQGIVHVHAGTHDEEHDEWQEGDRTEAPETFCGATNAYLDALYREVIGWESCERRS